MKRLLVVVGLPLLLALIWGISRSGDERTAEVDIVAAQPTELRGSVIARLRSLGGERIAEHTSFDGSGQSELRFRVPTARLDEALGALDQLGARVTGQRVDLEAAGDRADDVGGELDTLQRCLGDVSSSLSGRSPEVAAARDDLSTCQAQLRGVDGDFSTSSVDLAQTELLVKISPESGDNPILVLAVILLGAAGVLTATLIWRSARYRRDVDLRGMSDWELGDDLHLRRN